MSEYIKVNNLLTEKFRIPENKIINQTLDVKDFDFKRLHGILLALGGIVFESEDESICLANVKSGFFNMNDAILAVQLIDNKLFVASFAEEGIINQRTAERAIEELIKVLKKG